MIPGRCRSSHNWHRSTTSRIGNVHASAFLLNPLSFLQCKRLEGFFVRVRFRETVQGHLRHLRLQLIALPIVGTCVIAIAKCITKTWRNWFLLTWESLQPLGDYATNTQGRTTQNRWIVTLDSRCSGSCNSMNTTEPKVLHYSFC